MESDDVLPLMRPLNRRECMDLLMNSTVGRFCAYLDGELIVVPVNYAVFERDILIRTNPGSKLAAATAGLKVAFEVDEFAADGSHGWSVLVRGPAHEISVGGEVVKAIAVPLATWAYREPPTRLVRISTVTVTGRHFIAPD